MLIRGGTRGNGKQLAGYLLKMAENEHIEIFDIDGRDNRSEAYLHKTLLSMSLTSELTKSDKGLYHGIINPAYGEDKKMSREDWLKAADMMGEALTLENQRRVIVLHRKKGRTHAHVVWERYDHERGIMVSDSFSRLAQDRVRHQMEEVFEHKKTPARNPHRPEMKATLSQLWEQSKDGEEFIKAATKEGYAIARGLKRRPFMVVDSHARSFDLVRQLGKEIKTDDVRQKLSGTRLPSEKTALLSVQSNRNAEAAQESMLDKAAQHQERAAAKAEQQTKNRVSGFADNKDDAVKQGTNQQFDQNKTDLSKATPEELEAYRRKLMEEQKAMLEQQKQQRKRKGPHL